MTIFDLFFAALVLAIGLAVIYYLGRLFVGEIIGLVSGKKLSTDIWFLHSATKHLAKADSLIAKHSFDKALYELAKAVVFNSASSPNQVYRLKEHYQGILSRCLILAEERGQKLGNIMAVERLLIERSELQNLALKVKTTFSDLHSRRSVAGKSMPSWGKNDYNERAKRIDAQLIENRSNLEKELKLVFQTLMEKKSQVTIH